MKSQRHAKTSIATCALALLAAVVLLPSPALATNAPAGKRPLEAFVPTVDIRIPSTSTGETTGSLVARLCFPSPGDYRHADGAPVVVWVPGGAGPTTSLSNVFTNSCSDFIMITFLFPGTKDASAWDPEFGWRESDGVFDQRGANTILALRDVLLFAAGLKKDAQGRAISEVSPGPVATGNIGLMGVSNGGNLATAVAAEYGDELNGHLRYIIQWETPVSSQMATCDLGVSNMSHALVEAADYFNPRYQGYGPLEVDVDYSELVYAPNAELPPVFLDFNADGAFQSEEDYPLDGFPGEDGSSRVYSRPVTEQLAKTIAAGEWPADIATTETADAYWDLRESVRHYQDAVARIPDLEGMVLCNVTDHVQAAPIKPHIHQAFDGWNSAGAWVKINPDPVYLAEILPQYAERDDLPRNAPNTPPADWSAAETYAEPDAINQYHTMLAAWRQMSDRAAGIVSDDTAPIRDMIRSFYRTILGREPEAGSVDAWHHGYFDYAIHNDIDVRFVPREMARVFFLSQEYANRERTDAQFITDCYNVFLDREPSQVELETWLEGEWIRSEVMTIFSESEEFAERVAAMYPNLRSDPARNFITTMYVGMLDRLVDGGGLEYFVREFSYAQDKRARSVQMAEEIMNSQEFEENNDSAEDYITRFYRAFMGRFPSIKEVHYWAYQVDSGAETYHSIVEQFSNSPEFSEKLNKYFGEE